MNEVITLEEIRAKALGSVIEISDWDGSGKISVRVRAVDMSPHFMKLKSMPNKLKASADGVFNPAQNQDVEISMDEMLPILDGIAEGVLVEPTYAEIQEIYPLTLTQKLEIFKFAMGGIDNLNSFR